MGAGGSCQAWWDSAGLLEARGVALGTGEAEGAVGMAVFDGWRCVEQEAGSEGTFALMEAWKKGQKKEVRGFLEHRVLASCAFRSVPALPQDWEYMPAEMAGRRAVEQLRGRGLEVAVAGRPGGQCMDAVLAEWEERWA